MSQVLGLLEQMRREQERAEIRAQIDELNGRIERARKVREDFSNTQRDVNNSLVQWGDAYASYSGNEMASVVMVTDRFEGAAAEKFSKELPETIKQMDISKAIMNNIKGGIASQLQKLQEYIAKLEQRVRELWDRYYSL